MTIAFFPLSADKAELKNNKGMSVKKNDSNGIPDNNLFDNFKEIFEGFNPQNSGIEQSDSSDSNLSGINNANKTIDLTHILDLLPDVKLTSTKSSRHLKVDEGVLKQIINLSDDKESKFSGGDIIAALAELINMNSKQGNENIILKNSGSSLQELIDSNFSDIRQQRSKEIIGILNDIVNMDGLEQFTELPENKELISKIKSLLKDNPELLKELLNQNKNTKPGARLGELNSDTKVESIADYLPKIHKNSKSKIDAQNTKTDLQQNNGKSLQQDISAFTANTESLGTNNDGNKAYNGTNGASQISGNNSISMTEILSITNSDQSISNEIVQSKPIIKISKHTSGISEKFSPLYNDVQTDGGLQQNSVIIENNESDGKDNFGQNFKNGQNNSDMESLFKQALDKTSGLLTDNQNVSGNNSDGIKNESESRFQSDLKPIQLAKLPDKLIQKISEMPNNTVYQAKMTLTPKSLGTIFVSISMKDNVLKIDVKADSVDAKHALEGTASVLRDKLNDGGLKLDSFNVNVNRDFNQQDDTANRQGENQNRREALKYLKALANGSTADSNNFSEDLSHFGKQGSFLEKYL